MSFRGEIIPLHWDRAGCPDFGDEINAILYCIGTKQSVLTKQDVLISGCPHLGVPL